MKSCCISIESRYIITVRVFIIISFRMTYLKQSKIIILDKIETIDIFSFSDNFDN